MSFLDNIDWGLFFAWLGMIGLPLIMWSIHKADQRRDQILPAPSKETFRGNV